jgi:hypothetical protein
MMPKVPFAETKRGSEFSQALFTRLAEKVTALREEVIPPQNVSNLPHGHGWTFQQQREGGFELESAEFGRQSTEVSVHHDRILNNDLSVVDEFIAKLAHQMHDEMMERLTQELDETCTRFNRITNVPKGTSLAEGILGGLSKIHASVDEDGSVSMPSLMLSPEMFERLRAEVSVNQGELERQAAEIRAKTEADARARETERLAEYDTP